MGMWVAFLAKHDLLKVDGLPQVFDDSLKKAIKVLDVMNFTPEEREAYEEHLKWLRVEAKNIKKAQSRAKAEGKAESKLEIARNLIANEVFSR
jgi:hypothetical protein